MDINKGMFLDGYATDKPHGAWNYAKNILLADGFKSARNEKGFENLFSTTTLVETLALLDWFYPVDSVKIVGHEFIKDYFILYLYVQDSVYVDTCCILKYSIPDDEYSMILRNETGAGFYFHPDYYMDSMHTFTPEGDLVIAFCNGVNDVCIEPMLINVDKRREYYLNNRDEIVYLNLLYLFNRTDHIIEDYSIIDDGELDPGVYYCTIRFEYLDGTKSNWCMLTQPLKIGSNPDKGTGSAIAIKGVYSGAYAYKSVDVAYIRKFKGQVYAYEYGNFEISSSYDDYTYTYSYEFDITILNTTGTLVDLDSLLIRRAFYRKGTSIAFVDNKVHLASIKEENLFLNYQNFADDIIVGPDVVLFHKDEGSRPTFAPGEVYALYIYFILKGSGVIALPFNIPGRKAYFNDVSMSGTIASTYNAGGGIVGVICSDLHYMNTGDSVTISGTTDYNGTFIIIYHNSTTFLIVDTWTSNQSGAFVRNTNFSDFYVNRYTSNRFLNPPDVPSISIDLNYNILPGSKYIKIEIISYHTGSGETINTISLGLLKNATFTTTLKGLLDAYFSSESMTITTTVISTSVIRFAFTTTDINGLHFRYTVYETYLGEDITNSYANVLTCNDEFTHILVGARPLSVELMHYWENDISNGGGRHHRFPNIKAMASICNAVVANSFGISRSVLLGLKLQNIIIPSVISDKVSYMGIAYAKRTAENKMFYGDSLLLHYHDLSGALHATPTQVVLKDGYNAYADNSPSNSSYSDRYLYLDNFDILNNNIKVKLTDVSPEYAITFNDMLFYTYRCNDDDTEYLRGTLLHDRGAASSDILSKFGTITLTYDVGGGKVGILCSDSHRLNDGDSVTIFGTTDYNGTYIITYIDANNFSITDTWTTSQSGSFTKNALVFSENIDIDFNIIIPHDIVFDPDISFDYSKIQNLDSVDPNFRSMGRGITTYSLSKIDNTGGQQHIFAHTEAISATPISNNYGSSTVSSASANLSDNTNTKYKFTSNAVDGLLRRTSSIKIGVGSLYSMKDSVYIDPKSQVIIPCGNPIEITGPGVYEFDLNDVGDCVVSEKTTLFTGDPFVDSDTSLSSSSGGSNVPSQADARSLLKNHVQASTLRLGNKVPFTHLTYGISLQDKIYRENGNDPQSNIMLLNEKGDDAKAHNNYIPPTIKYSNDYNSLQDLDTPQFIKKTPEYNLNKIIKGTNYKNEDIDISSLKTFLVDDYYVMPGNKKEIISIREMAGGLIIQQRHGLFHAFIKDYLDLKGTNAYLGTGALFDRPPRELLYGNVDSINCPHILSTKVFRYGYAVFDDYAKKLYLFDGREISCISNNYASEYFNTNYDFSEKYYNPLSSIGSGVVLGFDGENNNLHILKKLYGGINNNLSFSFLINNFLSFHQWIPTYMLNSENKVFSFDSELYSFRHNDASKVCLFYDQTTPSPSILDIIFKGENEYKDFSKIIENVNWETQSIRLSDSVNLYDTTFDYIMLYNDDQCSGYISLADGNWFYKNKRDIVKTWNFNEFRDLVVNNKLAFLDSNLEPNTNVSSDKSWFNKSVFTGKHIIVRVKTNNSTTGGQKKLIINNMNIEAKIAIR